jgi:8-oxo-dGTP pyrophosphatase MutT (NUDIX family)
MEIRFLSIRYTKKLNLIFEKMIKEWKCEKTEEVLSLNIFNILEKYYRHPNKNRTFKANILDAPDWVNIVGINDKSEILLIRQFRFGTESIELEIPGGIKGEQETPKDAALRELEEETGYRAKTIKKIGSVAANPAFMNNECYTFIASLSNNKGVTNFDPNEIIEIEFASLRQVKTYLKDGKFRNAYCVIGLFWYLFREIL